MPEKSLTDRLRESLELTRARQAEENAADQLALSQPSDPETQAMDEQSDRQVEQIMLTDQQQVKQAQFSILNLVGAWLQAPAYARELCLTALLAPHRRIIQPRTDQYPEHMCGPGIGSSTFRLVCSSCLCEPIYGFPEETRRKIQLAAASPPVDAYIYQELGAETLIEQALERYSVKVSPLEEPPGSVEVSGTLGRRLADLIREPEMET